MTVAFASGPAEVKGKALADLVHGWAITVHRAQGSEFPAVVVVLPPEAGGMLSRPLVYTALTRAQRHLSVVHAAGPLWRARCARSARCPAAPGCSRCCGSTVSRPDGRRPDGQPSRRSAAHGQRDGEFAVLTVSRAAAARSARDRGRAARRE